MAIEKNFSFKGMKKATKDRETFFEGCFIENKTKTEDIPLGANLFSGTVWLFSHTHLTNHLDYLFIDEAGQVALANVVAMGLSTKNIVLVGDQMQLGQPVQGVHPGEAGLSILEFLLQNHVTIPKERGFFLENTYRLKQDICGFISNAFYDGKLKADKSTEERNLVLNESDLPDKGIVFVPATHEDCSQKSFEEGQIVKARYLKLLGQSFKDETGTRPLNEKDILVVTPYNAQVNCLKSLLPEKARVGTIDKFQGQEAPVVLISLVTSSGEKYSTQLGISLQPKPIECRSLPRPMFSCCHRQS